MTASIFSIMETAAEQIDAMLRLWDSFPDEEKPEWLSREQINAYARKMGVEL